MHVCIIVSVNFFTAKHSIDKLRFSHVKWVVKFQEYHGSCANLAQLIYNHFQLCLKFYGLNGFFSFYILLTKGIWNRFIWSLSFTIKWYSFIFFRQHNKINSITIKKIYFLQECIPCNLLKKDIWKYFSDFVRRCF